MCVVSMISDHYMHKWPPATFPTQPPFIWPKPSIIEWEEYKELKRKAAEYDRLTNQPDCQDEEKRKWEAEMEELLKRRPTKRLYADD